MFRSGYAHSASAVTNARISRALPVRGSRDRAVAACSHYFEYNTLLWRRKVFIWLQDIFKYSSIALELLAALVILKHKDL